MGGGSTILFLYSLCCIGTLTVIGLGLSLVYWGRWEERRARKRTASLAVAAGETPPTDDETPPAAGDAPADDRS